MTPKVYFDEVWQRCELFTALYGFLETHGTAVLQPDELLRAEWASRVSALDLYIHLACCSEIITDIRRQSAELSWLRKVPDFE